MRTREVTHIHQNKHGWPLRARPSFCSELPSCWAWLGSLTVNLYTIILSPALTRHLLLWRAKCLCARTPRPLLSLEFCLHAWARNIKGHMGEKKSSPWASALLTEPGFCQTWRGIYLFKIFKELFSDFNSYHQTVGTNSSTKRSNEKSARQSQEMWSLRFYHSQVTGPQWSFLPSYIFFPGAIHVLYIRPTGTKVIISGRSITELRKMHIKIFIDWFYVP